MFWVDAELGSDVYLDGKCPLHFQKRDKQTCVMKHKLRKQQKICTSHALILKKIEGNVIECMLISSICSLYVISEIVYGLMSA